MRHERWVKFALKKARMHRISRFRCRHVAVVVRGGRLLSIGYNHTKAGRLFDPIFEDKGYHAEIDALERLSDEELDGAVLYVVGMTRQGKILNSRPCFRCQVVLERLPLKDVLYLDGNVIRSLWHDDEMLVTFCEHELVAS